MNHSGKRDTEKLVEQEKWEELLKLPQREEEVVPCLIKLLNAEEWKVRKNAAHVLGKIAQEEPHTANLATTHLMELLDDDSKDVRKEAVSSLGKVAIEYPGPGFVAEPIVDRLIKLLYDETKEDVQGDIAFSLGDIGLFDTPSTIKPATTRLIDLLNVDDRVIYPLGIIAGRMDSTDPITILTNLLYDKDQNIRKGAVSYLGEKAKKYPDAVKPAAIRLIVLLNDKSEEIRRIASSTLEMIGEQEAIEINKLVQQENDEQLLKLHRRGEKVIPYLIELWERNCIPFSCGG